MRRTPEPTGIPKIMSELVQICLAQKALVGHANTKATLRYFPHPVWLGGGACDFGFCTATFYHLTNRVNPN